MSIAQEDVPTTLGLAYLARVASDAASLRKVWEGLVERATAEPTDSGAWLDLSTLLQLTGAREKGLEIQAAALADKRCFRKVHGRGGGLRILAFVIAGDMMANTPLDFLLEGSDAELTLCYLDGAPPPASELPDHDVAFLAIGQSEESARLLSLLRGAFDNWPRPVANNRPELIAALTRDRVAARFSGHPQILYPPTFRMTRAALAPAVLGAGDALGGLQFPLIVRPVGSHAGKGLERVEGPAALGVYLALHPAEEFFVAPFVDYAGPDGLYRKLRVVFVGGRPFLAHMAISSHWMVHYLNADMDQHAPRRDEEAAAMASFEAGFAARHAGTFEALCAAFDLDYFGVDCAETADGRLLLFEADVAMIVHAMDPPDLYPYKGPAMAKLFSGFLKGMSDLRPAVRTAA